MTEARPHLIRAGRGRVRVLRFVGDGVYAWPLRYEVAPGQPWCRHCGCTNRFGCVAPHCCWANVEQTLCSRCAERTTR